MGRLQRGWEISKASWRVLSQDRELVWVPVLAGVAALIAAAIVAVPGIVVMGGIDAGSSSDLALWLVFAFAATAAAWMCGIGQATVIAGAAERMEGGDPTLTSSFSVARERAARILGWAVLATAVSVVLDQIEQRLGILGRVVSWIGSTAFAVLSFLALPVIVFEDVGAIEAFRRSSRMLKSTWGEQLTFSFAIGLIGFLAILPGFLVAGLLAATGVGVLVLLGIVTGVVWVVVVMAVTSALSAVFKAALYRWAKGLPVDAEFDVAVLEAAFHRK